MDNVKRCSWCQDNGLMQEYHDMEWGVALHDDKKQFEFLMLEVMQCGLNWSLMLKKRETFKACFDNFDYEKIALYDENKIESILNTPDMIKSERKVRAIIHNANMFLKLRQELGSFDKYLWGFTDNKTMIYESHIHGEIPASNELSDKISRDLKKRGFKYLGSVTVYAHLQSCGIINDHSAECFRYAQLINKGNVIIK